MSRRYSIVSGLSCLCVLVASSLPFSGQTRTVLVPPRHHTEPRGNVPPPASAAPAPAIPAASVLPAGQPLRIQLDRRYRMRKGALLRGRLIDPVYLEQNIVLPKGTVVEGTIANLEPVGKADTTWARLDGDMTPLKRPALTFTGMDLPGGRHLALTANATERTAAVVKMSPPPKKQSLLAKAKAQIDQKKQSVQGILHSHHKSDMALKFLYGQLPYHPQDIWAGTQFDAVLTQPLHLPPAATPKPLPLTPPQGHLPPGTLEARLDTGLSSATNKVGNPIVAELTQPYLNATKTDEILPTGTQLLGVVTQAKPARKFGHNGTLRFAFRQVKLPSGALQQMHGQMTAVEGTKGQNVTVDSEGGAKANSGQGKFLAPILLGAMAGHSFDADQGAAEAGVYSNGFGVVARIVGFVVVTPAVSAGFAFYGVGKSITRRWLMPGHNVVFAKNTRMQLAVADR